MYIYNDKVFNDGIVIYEGQNKGKKDYLIKANTTKAIGRINVCLGSGSATKSTICLNHSAIAT